MTKEEKTQNNKLLKMYKESFLMYEKTKKECRERMGSELNDDGSAKYSEENIAEKINMIETMQNEVKEKFLMNGGNITDLLVSETSKKTKTPLSKNNVKKMVNEKPQKVKKPIIPKKTENNAVVKPIEEAKSNIHNELPVSVVPQNWSEMDFSESFDVIPLPSKGECYDTNMSTIAVSYLTANDENMIISPNLYRDGLILDYLLRAKIKNSNIDPDDLIDGDRDAIILWLRATSYGTQYPITVTDTKTGIDFDAVVDLTQIKHKPFTLHSDSNGCFDFTLPVSKDEIKFKFLTHGEVKYIEDIDKAEQGNVKKDRLIKIAEEIEEFINNDSDLTKDEKLKLYEAKRNISKWADKIEVDNDLGYTHKLTNRLEMSIVSVNGEEDRDYISNYVSNMNVRDALAIRRYISDNEPGLDFAVTVERPESLGGGSMPVFLSLDEYLFLNII
jgi:hypothetical protein